MLCSSCKPVLSRTGVEDFDFENFSWTYDGYFNKLSIDYSLSRPVSGFLSPYLLDQELLDVSFKAEPVSMRYSILEKAAFSY